MILNLRFPLWGTKYTQTVVLSGKGKALCIQSRKEVNTGSDQKGVGRTGRASGRRILLPRDQEAATMLDHLLFSFQCVLEESNKN